MNRQLAISHLQQHGTVILKCNGNSMRPLFAPGDSLHIKKIDSSQLQVGDAVFCKINGNLQVHKISAIKDGRWAISNNKGHLNGWVSSNSIFGVCYQVNDKVIRSA